MWGQANENNPYTPCGRIIPTRVGTRSKCLTHCMIQEDHPHACGDKRMLKKLTHTTLGSSPRVWGQASTAIFKPKTIRIIPTRVGTSSRAKIKLKRVEDHPHACGDKFGHNIFLSFEPGSSPRVWGQVKRKLWNVNSYGIIPTRVGTSSPPIIYLPCW